MFFFYVCTQISMKIGTFFFPAVIPIMSIPSVRIFKVTATEDIQVRSMHRNLDKL
jgi:hypothetical protein